MTELCKIASKYPTDKFGHHNFTPIYHKYLKEHKYRKTVLLEHGVGGYNFPDRGGGSLRMWEDYLLFPSSKIISTDIYDKSDIIKGSRTKIYKGSQNDKWLAEKIIIENECPDVIIDDASHNSEVTIETFELWFPLLKDGGLYFVEDVHTSYWDSEEYMGNPDVTNYEYPTALNFFKWRVDEMNYEHNKDNIKDNNPYKINHIAFYKEMVVIEKI